MGLDMYLHKKTYVKNWSHKEKGQYSVLVKKDNKIDPAIKPERIVYVEEEIAYWRKANAIHAWFVANVQDGKDDCRDAYVTREKLKKLFDICEEVLRDSKLVPGQVVESYTFDGKGQKVPNYMQGKIIENPATAERLLPTTSGFFFGSTDYDEYYLQDIEYTAKTLKEELLQNTDGEYVYHSSW